MLILYKNEEKKSFQRFTIKQVRTKRVCFVLPELDNTLVVRHADIIPPAAPYLACY